jgi:hypothetical protein
MTHGPSDFGHHATMSCYRRNLRHFVRAGFLAHDESRKVCRKQWSILTLRLNSPRLPSASVTFNRSRLVVSSLTAYIIHRSLCKHSPYSCGERPLHWPSRLYIHTPLLPYPSILPAVVVLLHLVSSLTTFSCLYINWICKGRICAGYI